MAIGEPLINRLREMILDGELQAGERVTEIGVAERLGVSRTPVRNVLPVLALEGLLRPVGRRGFAVSDFNDQESLDALELRSVLEGQAGRLVSRKGASLKLLTDLRECLAEGDALFKGREFATEKRSDYGRMNARFHLLIVQAAESPMLASFIDRLNRVSFVDPGVIVFDKVPPERVFDLLFLAHSHHHAIVEAIATRDEARVDALFREHAHGQRSSMFEKRLPIKA